MTTEKKIAKKKPTPIADDDVRAFFTCGECGFAFEHLFRKPDGTEVCPNCEMIELVAEIERLKRQPAPPARPVPTPDEIAAWRDEVNVYRQRAEEVRAQRDAATNARDTFRHERDDAQRQLTSARAAVEDMSARLEAAQLAPLRDTARRPGETDMDLLRRVVHGIGAQIVSIDRRTQEHGFTFSRETILVVKIVKQGRIEGA